MIPAQNKRSFKEGYFYEEREIFDFGLYSPVVGWRTRAGKLRGDVLRRLWKENRFL